MNKKLVAVAVAAVLASPLAAQAQSSNVTLYGRVHLDLEYIDVNQGLPSTQRLSSNSSRLGVRGTESLGGGLNAIFQIESALSADAGGGQLATRETFIGLQGSWGTVKWGNFLAPYDDMHPIFGNTPTLTTSILATAAIWANTHGLLIAPRPIASPSTPLGAKRARALATSTTSPLPSTGIPTARLTAAICSQSDDPV